MRVALVVTGVVENVVVVPDTWTGAPDEWRPPAGTTVVPSLTASPGDTYAGGVFSDTARLAAEAAALTAEAARIPERKTLRDQAAVAIADLDTFLALSSPTNAQNAAALKRLAQMMRAVLKRLVQID